MNELTNEASWAEKLDFFLTIACETEANKNLVEAERFFGMALFCEAKLRPEVVDARQYVTQAGPVYAVAQLMS